MANLFQLLLAQIHPRQGRPAGEPERAEGYKTHPKRESNNKVRETRVLETGESTQERERIQTEVEKEDFLLSFVRRRNSCRICLRRRRIKYRNCSRLSTSGKARPRSGSTFWWSARRKLTRS